MKRFVFLDPETSGLDADHGELISLSALRVSKEGSERFCTLLCPASPLSQAAEILTGLTNACLSQAPDAVEAIGKFEDWRKEDPIVLCRPEFDLPFLRVAYQRAGREFRQERVHTVEEDHVKLLLWKHLF